MKKTLFAGILLIFTTLLYSQESHFVLLGGEIHNTDTIFNKGVTVYAECNLRIRNSQDLNSQKIGQLLAGEKVQITEIGKEDEIDNIKSNWIKVKNDKIEGWCFGGYLSSPKTISITKDKYGYSISSDETEDKKSFYLYNYNSDKKYCTFEDCYLATSTSWSDQWYPYICFVNRTNNILYVYNVEEGTIIPTVKVKNFPAQYATVTPNKKYIIYTNCNKEDWEKDSTRYIYIHEIKTQRLVSKIEKYCEEQNYVIYHFQDDPNNLRINVDEECAGDGLIHCFYFNQETENISYASNWNVKWSDCPPVPQDY